MQLTNRNPWELMSVLRRDVDRLFNAEPQQADFVPAVDIHEEESRFVVFADLPGIRPAEIELTVEGDLLTIRGERTTPELAEGATVQRSERLRGRFERSFRLPDTAASKGFEADYRDGVLSVSIPKAEAATPYRIEVSAN